MGKLTFFIQSGEYLLVVASSSGPVTILFHVPDQSKLVAAGFLLKSMLCENTTMISTKSVADKHLREGSVFQMWQYSTAVGVCGSVYFEQGNLRDVHALQALNYAVAATASRQSHLQSLYSAHKAVLQEESNQCAPCRHSEERVVAPLGACSGVRPLQPKRIVPEECSQYANRSRRK